jgi:hypothetical protein
MTSSPPCLRELWLFEWTYPPSSPTVNGISGRRSFSQSCLQPSIKKTSSSPSRGLNRKTCGGLPHCDQREIGSRSNMKPMIFCLARKRMSTYNNFVCEEVRAVSCLRCKMPMGRYLAGRALPYHPIKSYAGFNPLSGPDFLVLELNADSVAWPPSNRSNIGSSRPVHDNGPNSVFPALLAVARAEW